MGLLRERDLVLASTHPKHENPLSFLRDPEIGRIGFEDSASVAVRLSIGHETEEGGLVSWMQNALNIFEQEARGLHFAERAGELSKHVARIFFNQAIVILDPIAIF